MSSLLGQKLNEALNGARKRLKDIHVETLTPSRKKTEDVRSVSEHLQKKCHRLQKDAEHVAETAGAIVGRLSPGEPLRKAHATLLRHIVENLRKVRRELWEPKIQEIHQSTRAAGTTTQSQTQSALAAANAAPGSEATSQSTILAGERADRAEDRVRNIKNRYEAFRQWMERLP